MCITEHWISKCNNIVNIENYKLSSSFVREKAFRGDSLILMRNDIRCKSRPDSGSLRRTLH